MKVPISFDLDMTTIAYEVLTSDEMLWNDKPFAVESLCRLGLLETRIESKDGLVFVHYRLTDIGRHVRNQLSKKG